MTLEKIAVMYNAKLHPDVINYKYTAILKGAEKN